MKRSLLIHFLTLCVSVFFIIPQTKAQNTQITGTIKDEKNNPVDGATVAVKNKNRAVTTNSEGYFAINAGSGRYTGYYLHWLF